MDVIDTPTLERGTYHKCLSYFGSWRSYGFVRQTRGLPPCFRIDLEEMRLHRRLSKSQLLLLNRRNGSLNMQRRFRLQQHEHIKTFLADHHHVNHSKSCHVRGHHEFCTMKSNFSHHHSPLLQCSCHCWICLFCEAGHLQLLLRELCHLDWFSIYTFWLMSIFNFSCVGFAT